MLVGVVDDGGDDCGVCVGLVGMRCGLWMELLGLYEFVCGLCIVIFIVNFCDWCDLGERSFFKNVVGRICCVSVWSVDGCEWWVFWCD